MSRFGSDPSQSYCKELYFFLEMKHTTILSNKVAYCLVSENVFGFVKYYANKLKDAYKLGQHEIILMILVFIDEEAND